MSQLSRKSDGVTIRHTPKEVRRCNCRRFTLAAAAAVGHNCSLKTPPVCYACRGKADGCIVCAGSAAEVQPPSTERL